MEPPVKRLRLSPRDESRPLYPRGKAELREEASTLIRHVPTRTLDLQDFERRHSGQERSIHQRNAGIRLLPRVPDVTVTANFVNIAILDGSDQTSTTQIAMPTTDLMLSIPRVGTVTVSGISKSTGTAAGSGSSVGSPSAGVPGTSGTGTITSVSTSVNGTSTNERTVTVTSVSSLHVSVKNGTVTLTSNSHHRTITSEGLTITVDDASTLMPSDYPSSGTGAAFATATVDPHNAGAGVTATSSSTDASPTATGGGIVLTPQQQQVVGGVVGSVAGVAIVLLAILYFLKWYRHRLESQGCLPKPATRHRQIPDGYHHNHAAPPIMTETSTSTLVPVASLKQSLQKLRPHSIYTLASTNTDRSSAQVAESERSFHRVSGRKIPSVLLTGGDGYGSHGHGPISSLYDQPQLSRSREVSQTSSLRDSNNSKNSVSVVTAPSSTPGYSTPPRQHISPFVDPHSEGQNQTPLSMAAMSTSVRDFTASNARRSHLTIQTAGFSALNPHRHSDGNVTIRPSPARTPTTTSPTNSSLRLPMHTPPLMSGDTPEMPPLQPWRHTMGPRKYSDDTLTIQRSMAQRSMSAISARSASSVGGKFKEDI